jgi:hypothetical protein
MKDHKDGVFVFFRLVSFFGKKGKKRNWRVTLRHDGVKIFNSMRWHWTREMLLGFRAYSCKKLFPCGLLPPFGLGFGLQAVGENANAINGATTETKLVPATMASVLSEGK